MAYWDNIKNSPWYEWLEEEPQAMYRGMLGGIGGRGRGQNFLDYWKSQYGNIYGDYMGRVGRQVLGGGDPTLSFYDFLNQFDFGQEWAKMAPWARGESRSPRGFWNLPGY